MGNSLKFRFFPTFCVAHASTVEFRGSSVFKSFRGSEMTISVGDRLPDVTVHVMGESAPEPRSSAEMFAGRKVVLFALPGAFTPTCSRNHLPGYVEHAQGFRDKGVDDIVCLSVNDAWVMSAWGKSLGAEGKVSMVADGNGAFTRAVGLNADMSAAGYGERSVRYAMIVDDGVVTHLNVEEPREFKISDAATMLSLI
jgi:peroxiredoxin